MRNSFIRVQKETTNHQSLTVAEVLNTRTNSDQFPYVPWPKVAFKVYIYLYSISSYIHVGRLYWGIVMDGHQSLNLRGS